MKLFVALVVIIVIVAAVVWYTVNVALMIDYLAKEKIKKHEKKS